MREKLLFVTMGNDNYEEGFPYVVELSGRIRKDIVMLIMYPKPSQKPEEGSTAAIGPAGGRGAAKKKASLLTEKYCRKDRALKISCKTAAGEIVPRIKEVVENEPAIDMVLFGPSLGSKRVINAKKILRDIAKPVVFVSGPV